VLPGSRSAYDTDTLIAHQHASGGRAVNPARYTRMQQRRYSREAYRRRNLIERCFCLLKQCRRIATRYEKRAERFVSFISLVAALCCVT
jgi:transposase